MTLGDFFERLALGELSQHTIGSTGNILAKDYPRVIAQLNLGLTALHVRFDLKEKEVILQQYADITEYTLDSKYAQTNTTSTEDPKYIMDTAENPFLDDVLRIDGAYNEIGCAIPINDVHIVNSIFTPNARTVQIPFPVEDNIMVITYAANHPKISPSTTDLTTFIDLPVALEDALAAYVATKLFISAGNTTFAGLSNYYRSEYERQIDYIVRQNTLRSSDTDISPKFQLGGWQ